MNPNPKEILLDESKIRWYPDRIRAWTAGHRFAPVTIDLALTQACNFRCQYCYANLQRNTPHRITIEHAKRFLNDCADIGVRGISLVSDGESTLSPAYVETITYGRSLGMSIASGTNAYSLDTQDLEEVLPSLTYLRINISAGEEARYREIMGAPADAYGRVLANIRTALSLRRDRGLSCSIGMQMVLLPSYADQILPLSRLALDLGVDYLVIKHCSDDELGTLGVPYAKYPPLFNTLRKAEGLSTPTTTIRVKWSKLYDGSSRPYRTCLATPFHLQISGTGLVAPCGMLFGRKYSKYHMGNITTQNFREIWSSDRYWEIVAYLASSRFSTNTCGCLCLQHLSNKYLHEIKAKKIIPATPIGVRPPHIDFL